MIVSKQVMKYDAEKNAWTPVASVPQNLEFIFCAAPWREWIFVSGVNEKDHPITYFFQPSNGQWKAIDRGQEFARYPYPFVSALTFEI